MWMRFFGGDDRKGRRDAGFLQREANLPTQITLIQLNSENTHSSLNTVIEHTQVYL